MSPLFDILDIVPVSVIVSGTIGRIEVGEVKFVVAGGIPWAEVVAGSMSNMLISMDGPVFAIFDETGRIDEAWLLRWVGLGDARFMVEVVKEEAPGSPDDVGVAGDEFVGVTFCGPSCNTAYTLPLLVYIDMKPGTTDGVAMVAASTVVILESSSGIVKVMETTAWLVCVDAGHTVKSRFEL